ncbi:MAG TPA: ATP-binding protein [Polyangiaceae bacterium]
MKKVANFLLLPREITEFERGYLQRVNRIAVWFFAAHIPLFAIIAAWNGTRPALAVLLTSAVLVGPLLVRKATPNPRALSVACGLTAMFMGGLLVHFGQGPVQIEMHFYFFALLAMCAVFGNPLVIVAAAGAVAVHHLILFLVLPKSVFNYEAQWWVVAVHASFVVLESVATCFIARSFFDNVIGLEKIVAARTAELDSKNRDMRLLLDNVEQGFLTIDLGGTLAPERSAAVTRWLGAPAPNATWFDYLATIDSTFAERSRFAWEDVSAGLMPLEVTLGQMPDRFEARGAHYRVEYRAIGSELEPQHFLVIVTDVTTQVERERAEVERREAMALFERSMMDRTGFDSFIEETNETLAALQRGESSDPLRVKRQIHTLKGNAALYGLSSLAQECHRLEDLIAERGELPKPDDYARIEARWAELHAVATRLRGARAHGIDLEEADLTGLRQAVERGESKTALVRQIERLKLEPSVNRLRHFQEQAKRISERLGKDAVRVELEDHGVRLDPRIWGEFWAAFGHAIRNALDHGTEPVSERAASGKPESGTLSLRTLENDAELVIEIADDGRGIDWQALAERARAAGLPVSGDQALEQALFADGISTSAEVTDLSGRGVGMGALRAAAEALGGVLRVSSQLGVGTTLRFSFPPALQQRSPEGATPLAAVG